MKKAIFLMLASICVGAVTAVAVCGFSAIPNGTVESPFTEITSRVTVENNAEIETGEVGQTVAVTEQPSAETNVQDDINRLMSMLSINCCYNDAFSRDEALVMCAAIALKDFAVDVDGYGICVNAALVSGFAKDFYGVSFDDAVLYDADAPKGYIMIEPYGVGSFYHTLVSVTATADGYEVVTCLKTYYGGSDMTDCLVRSNFIRNESSEFGFVLALAEVL